MIVNYSHVLMAGGLSGETWDIAQGFDREYTSSATATTFTTGTNLITLSSGTFPAWLRVIGTYFTTDSATNPGPFRVKASASTTSIEVHEALTTEGTVTVVFDGDKEPLIQDVLLQTGNGALFEDTPLVLVSTGALGGARQLDLAGMEVESAAKGGMEIRGRIFTLNILNSDITTNNITVKTTTVGGTVNGASTMVISSLGSYLFQHTQAGAWIANVLPLPAEKLATIARVSFTSALWDADPSDKDTIVILQSGSPTGNEAGPHLLTPATTYNIDVFNTDGTRNELVEVEVQVDPATGDIVMMKAPRQQDFNGVAVIVGALD